MAHEVEYWLSIALNDLAWHGTNASAAHEEQHLPAGMVHALHPSILALPYNLQAELLPSLGTGDAGL